MAAPARDFVLVASQAAEQIVPLLASLGFTPSQDYSVLDVDLLATAAVTPLV
jgi:acetylglutamate kinase